LNICLRMIFNIRYFCFFLLVFLLRPGLSFSECTQDRVKELAALLQNSYEDTSDIAAEFVQETTPAGATEGLRAAGKVYFKRPRLMRWEYRTPDPQLIVTCGNVVYVYEEEANQVMILPRDQFLSSEISRAFFFGKGDLEKSFRAEAPDADWPNASWTLKLTPRDPVQQVRALWITLNPESHLVSEMLLEDQLGGRTHIILKDVKVNTGVKASIFQFIPPPGVEIYRADQ
jgi:outer membrane lipoprotein carrier protein